MTAIEWQAAGKHFSAAWLSANGRPAPKRVIAVDDRLTADAAVKYASQGLAMLWLGDFHNARQLLSAVDRRLTKRGTRRESSRQERNTGARASATAGATPDESSVLTVTPDEFYRIRQARAHRARVLSLILVPIRFDGEPQQTDMPTRSAPKCLPSVPLSRAPELADIISFGYADQPSFGGGDAVVSLQELVGVMSAHQWFVHGVDVPSLGAKIHPHYGTFLPTRHEYVDLVAEASPSIPLESLNVAFDIGVGTGVLSAVLAQRGVQKVIGTDIHQRAVNCATDNFARLGISDIASATLGSMFPAGTADLIVCNPPWLPGSAPTTLDAAVYDPESKMLLDFLAGLPKHLTKRGEGWLVLSDLAELLGLRSREALLEAIAAAGLTVVERLDTVPRHGKVRDSDDPLHAARARETTSLWRLRVATV